MADAIRGERWRQRPRRPYFPVIVATAVTLGKRERAGKMGVWARGERGLDSSSSFGCTDWGPPLAFVRYSVNCIRHFDPTSLTGISFVTAGPSLSTDVFPPTSFNVFRYLEPLSCTIHHQPIDLPRLSSHSPLVASFVWHARP